MAHGSYEAKRAAEVNRHVGKLTTFEVLVQKCKRFDISDTCFNLLKKAVEKRHVLPKVEFKGEYLEILEDEPAKESHQDLPLSSSQTLVTEQRNKIHVKPPAPESRETGGRLRTAHTGRGRRLRQFVEMQLPEFVALLDYGMPAEG